MATYNGNDSSNTFSPLSSSDKYYLYGGNDVVYCGAGWDTAFGGTGDDYLDGGDGGDYLYGEAGNDKIYGGNEGDYLSGGAGDDYLDGGDDASSDGLIGGVGNDKLFGNAGSDELYGGQGNDVMQGGAGDDFIGDDYTGAGGGGVDQVTGAAGKDTFRIANWAGNNNVYIQDKVTDYMAINDWNCADKGTGAHQDKLQLAQGKSYDFRLNTSSGRVEVWQQSVLDYSLGGISFYREDLLAVVGAGPESYLSGSALLQNIRINTQYVTASPY